MARDPFWARPRSSAGCGLILLSMWKMSVWILLGTNSIFARLRS